MTCGAEAASGIRRSGVMAVLRTCACDRAAAIEIETRLRGALGVRDLCAVTRVRDV